MLDHPILGDRVMPEPNSGCWIWVGARTDGYGSVLRKKWGEGRAHRLAYVMARGPIPDGMQIDHKCRNRACVNPDHLEVVTQHENWLRGRALPRLNRDKTHCPKGHSLSAKKGGGRKCVTCERAHAKRQREENPEWYKAYQATYREQHREKARAYAREYQKRRREAARAC